MKRILLFIIALPLFYSCSGLKGTPVQMDPITSVIETSKEKDELYVSANNWMAETFNSAKSVIQFTDKEAGVVTGRYLLKPGYTYYNYSYVESEENSIYAIIKIQVKHGAARITITPDNFNEVTSDMIDSRFKFSRAEAQTKIDKLIAEFRDYVSNDNSQDW